VNAAVLCRRLGTAALVVALAAGGAVVGRAAEGDPSLRLFVTKSERRVVRRDSGRPVFLNLGLHLAPVGGPFELRVRRTSYRAPITVEQVVHSPTGDVSRPLPADVLEGWEGLKSFLKVEVTNAAGRVVARRSADICLNSFERERVNDEGPINPTYPVFCFANPFTKGMVWGLDEGWASNPFDFFGGPRMRVPDGTYTVTYRIAARYQELFGVSPDDGRATVALTVKTRERACTHCGRRGAQRLAEQFQEPIQSRAVPEDGDPPESILPDLRALPSWGIGVTSRRGRDFLAFGSTVWVAGASPLVVEGFRRDNSDVMDAFQYFYQDGEPVARAPVGELQFDTRRGHHHWHFKQFAGYRLLDSEKAVQVRSRKESFCLASTDAIDLSLAHADWTPEQLGLETACGFSESIWVRETLPVGWGDTYFQFVPGQSFDITRLPNGTYFIEVTANPTGEVHEQNMDNNTRLRRVILGGRPGRRRVRVPAWQGIDSEGGGGGIFTLARL
jgi:Lysyl oxidase